MEQRLCKILEHTEICKGYAKLKLEWSNADKIFKPGQFIEIKVNNTSDPLLRRPFSIFNADKHGIYIAYKILGKGTQELSSQKVNDKLDIIAPLGNGYDISNITSKKNILIGGGTGIASLFYLAKTFSSQNIDFSAYFGFKSSKDLFCLNDWQDFENKIKIATEDGSVGVKGFVTQFLKEIDDTSKNIFICGPEIMAKNIIKSINSKNIQISLEAYMACGIGICNGCVVKIKNSSNSLKNNSFAYKQVCKDGPVFLAEDILWE